MHLLGATFKITRDFKYTIFEKIIELIKSISTVFVDYLLNNYTAVIALPG